VTTGQDELGAEGRQTQLRAPSAASVRATSRPTRDVANSNAPESATITAELPITQHRPRGQRPAPGHHVPDARRLEPAPVLLRFFVWLLVVLLLIVACGVVVEQRRPGWLSFLRNTAPATPISPRALPATSSGASRSPSGTGGLLLVSKTPNEAIYSVPARSYSFALVLLRATYVEIKEPAGESGYWYLRTLQPTKQPATITGLTGSASVLLEQPAKSLEVRAGTRSLGVIHSPKARFIYIFQPHSH
jgi:hypothetical protein